MAKLMRSAMPGLRMLSSYLCLVGYAIFGPSKILVLGPDSSLGPMVAATIVPLVGANGDPAGAVALASMLALLVGGSPCSPASPSWASSQTCCPSRPKSAI
jgi:MFS superfamily sulfate permease-like transporter